MVKSQNMFFEGAPYNPGENNTYKSSEELIRMILLLQNALDQEYPWEESDTTYPTLKRLGNVLLRRIANPLFNQPPVMAHYNCAGTQADNKTGAWAVDTITFTETSGPWSCSIPVSLIASTKEETSHIKQLLYVE